MNTLLIETNQTCNFNCQYCFYGDYGRLNDVLTPQQFTDIINNESPQTIYLTGGEITLSKYFLKYINICYDKNIKCHIFTNGWLLLSNKDLLNKTLDKINSIIISLDSVNDNYKIRPHQKDIYLNLKELDADLKQKITVKISINYFNFNDLENTILKLLNIGITKLSINIVHNIINSNHNFELSNNSLKIIFKIIKNTQGISIKII